MATSGSVSFTVTTNDIITMAAKVIGKLGEDDVLSSNEFNDCKTMLNMMIKQWISKNDYAPGLKMFTRQRGFLFLSTVTGTYSLGSIGGTGKSHWTNTYGTTTSGGNNAALATTVNVATTTAATLNQQPDITNQTAAITANQTIGIQLDNGSLFWTTVSTVPTGTTITIPGPGLPSSCNNVGNAIFTFTTIATPPQIIETVNLRDLQGNDTPMQNLTLEQYMNLPSKQSPGYTGDPLAIYYEPHLVGNSGQGYGLLMTDVASAQNVSKVIVLSYISEIEDFVNVGDEAAFSKEWDMALVMGLAKHIAPMYNAVWSKQQEDNCMSSIRMARNSNQKRTTIGFCPGNVTADVRQLWR